MSDTKVIRGNKMMKQIEGSIPDWFWRYIFPLLVPILAVFEVCSGVPSLWRAIVAENMEAMPIETHIFNVVIGLIMIPYGTNKKDIDMVSLGILMVVMYSAIITITLFRGGIFLWQ